MLVCAAVCCCVLLCCSVACILLLCVIVVYYCVGLCELRYCRVVTQQQLCAFHSVSARVYVALIVSLNAVCCITL